MGLEIVSLILPCVKNLSASESHQLRHYQGIAGVTCWWQDQNPPHIVPEEFSLKVNLAALTMSVLAVPPSHSRVGDMQLSFWLKQQQSMLPAVLLPLSMTGAPLGLGPETLTKTDHSGCFLTLQQGCLLLVPESCYHSNIAMLAQTQIDSILIALISSLR